MTDIKLHLSDLNATQLARLYVTLEELGRDEEAAAVDAEGVTNCGATYFTAECNLLKLATA